MIEEFEYNGKIMGTEYSIAMVCNSKTLADEIYNKSVDEIKDYEKKFSRFLDDSELSILNIKKEMVVSSIFLTVTQKAYDLFVKTKGIFNPLVQVGRFGYDKNFLDLEEDIEIKEGEVYDIDFSTVIIDKVNSLIRLNEGQKLDFGGFLKGYLAEIVAVKIMNYSKEIKGTIVNLGGDIHTRGHDKHGNKFVFSIYNPIIKNEDIVVLLYNQSLATSGTYKRNWKSSNQYFHHILDQNGLENPKTDIVSVSVICKDGASSEAYTKVFLSMGAEKAKELLGDIDILYILIKNNGQIIKNI